MGLTNPQAEALQRQYDRKRAAAAARKAQRRQEVYARSEDFRLCEEELADLTYRRARASLTGEEDCGLLDGELKKCRARRTELLTSAGYPADWLDTVYECPLCQDTGFVGGEKCSCYRRAETELLFAGQPAQKHLMTDTFDRFRLDYYEKEKKDGDQLSPYEHMSRILEESRRYAEGFGKDSGNILLTGQTGTGKTYLCRCIAGEVLRRGFSAVMLSAERFFEILTRHALGKDEGDEAEWEMTARCDLIVIDDLGTEFTNSLVNAQLFSWLDERLVSGKPTVISTNLTMNRIRDLYSERVASRLIEGFRIFHLYNHDVDIRLLRRREEGGP